MGETEKNDSVDGSSPQAGKRLIGCGSILAGSSFVGLIAIVAGWVYFSQQADEQLAVQVAKVRARGEPLTTIELNDFYQPVANRPDMTGEILAALANCDSADLKPLAASLPIVGKEVDVPPAPGPWPQLEEAEAYLARQSAALETFRNVARREGTARFPIDFTAGISMALPHAQTMRQAARVLSLQFHVDLHRDRPHDAVDRILEQIALARTLDQEPILISQLVRLAVIYMAIGNVQQAIRQSEITDADLLRLQQGLRKIDYASCLKQALVGERAISYMACVDPRLAEGSVTLTPAQVRQLANRHPKRVADATKMLELNLRISEAADQSLLAAVEESTRTGDEIQQLSQGGWNRFSYALTRLLSPAYQQATRAFSRSAVKRDCADAALAAELYRRQRRVWPETLDDLVPEYLPRVPVDPYNGLSLKIISNSTELKVYSVGKDGKDDGGNIADREDPNTDVGFVLQVKGTNLP